MLEALEAFWTIDPALIVRYQELTKDKTFTDVHEIQENVVEKAPLYDEEQLVVAAITKAAESGSLISSRMRC